MSLGDCRRSRMETRSHRRKFHCGGAMIRRAACASSPAHQCLRLRLRISDGGASIMM